MKCAVCDQLVTTGSWCERHAVTAKTLAEHYPLWVKAYGDLSWEDYLHQIIGNPNTGSWVIEVAKTNPTPELLVE
ncbi:MAG: hypothetical protein ACW976_00240 [Candidatus Ranarchaeia archaeon]|jgi:hypothetical protein